MTEQELKAIEGETHNEWCNGNHLCSCDGIYNCDTCEMAWNYCREQITQLIAEIRRLKNE